MALPPLQLYTIYSNGTKIYVFRGSCLADLRMGTEDTPLNWINEDIYRVYILYDQVSTVPSLLNKVCNSI